MKMSAAMLKRILGVLLVLVVAATASLVRPAGAAETKQYRVMMVLWRGCEDACRGFQELNVAFGGTLHQHVQEVPGRSDHREDKDADLEQQYAPVHSISIAPGCLLADIVGAGVFQVNSLHSQGIETGVDEGALADAAAFIRAVLTEAV